MLLTTYNSEFYVVILEYWEVDCGDLGIHKFTSKQLDEIMQAENQKVRFVKINDILINTAYIKGAKKIIKKYTENDLNFKTISAQETKFITYDTRKNKTLKKFYVENGLKKYIIDV